MSSRLAGPSRGGRLPRRTAAQKNRAQLRANLEFEPTPEACGLMDMARCPRFMRLREECLERQMSDLGLPSETRASAGREKWNTATAKIVREMANKDDVNLWTFVLDAESIRMLPPAQCTRDGYVTGEAFVVCNGQRTMTVGRTNPINGDVHHNAFLAFYDSRSMTANDEEPGVGCHMVSQLNDSLATIYWQVARTMRRFLSVEGQLARMLAGNIALFSAASEEMDSLRFIMEKLCRHPEAYKPVMDMVNKKLNECLRKSAERIANPDADGTPSLSTVGQHLSQGLSSKTRAALEEDQELREGGATRRPEALRGARQGAKQAGLPVEAADETEYGRVGAAASALLASPFEATPPIREPPTVTASADEGTDRGSIETEDN